MRHETWYESVMEHYVQKKYVNPVMEYDFQKKNGNVWMQLGKVVLKTTMPKVF